MAIKTTHVGSLPRPAEMLTRIAKKETISDEDIFRYTKEIVDKQLSTGLTYINNGELGRTDYIASTVSRLSGFDGTCTAPVPRDMEELPAYSRRFGGRNGLITLNPKAPISLPACTGPVNYTDPSSLRNELDSLVSIIEERKSDHDDSAAFFTAPSPGTIALFLEDQHYANYRGYVEAIAAAMENEYRAIHESGFLLQIDCPDLAMGRHTTYKSLSDEEFLGVVDINIQVLNDALRGIPAEMNRIHVCWGNYAGTHHCDVDLGTIYDKVIGINARYISIESCNHRHAHEWELFKEVSFPDDKVLMPGVIDTNSNTVEHPDLVKLRLENFISLLGADRVIASTDCGFASTASAASVVGDVAWLKLESLVAGAARAGN